MLRSYKYRLYPTKKQKELINKHIGSCRFLYNIALETKITAYNGSKTNVSSFDLKKQLPDIPLFDSKQLDVTFAGYSDKLTDVTLYLLKADHETESFIGFVNPIEIPEKGDSATATPDNSITTEETINHINNGKSKKAAVK